MTNGDRIRAMSDEELAEHLDSFGCEGPWSDAFGERFCKNCPTTECLVDGYSKPMQLTECDFVDSVCPHGDSILWWLRQPVKDG